MTAQSAANNTSNHRLELVGEEAIRNKPHVTVIKRGPFRITYGQYSIESPWCGLWWWMAEIGRLFCGWGKDGNACTTEAEAMAAAEAALLEEIGKFVRVKE